MYNWKDIEFSGKELAHYSRQLSIPEFGIKGQKKLKAAKVLAVGTGGLGAPMLQYLAAAGVGTIGLVDFDTIDASNLHRSEEHTSELQSRFDLVCRLLLEKH